MGWDGAIPKLALSFKKNFQTRLLKLNPVPLGARRGEYPKKPAPLPSLSATCYKCIWKHILDMKIT